MTLFGETLIDKLCNKHGFRILYYFTIRLPLLVYTVYTKLHLPPFLTITHNGYFFILFSSPYGTTIACKCFQYVPAHLPSEE